MDIAALSIGLSHGKVKQEASLAIMNKTMNHAEQNAASLLQMMNSSQVKAVQHVAQPHLGGNVDVSR
ncbi:YjfB family protein [Jeotgalibacillus sp. JSM ZJ347]|uniref:YjfB family protein n=1 Tax=Jeotgalibacillus sp. JSM ZJ347 TaxID=3342117 RepID=UPI0035A8E671